MSVRDFPARREKGFTSITYKRVKITSELFQIRQRLRIGLFQTALAGRRDASLEVASTSQASLLSMTLSKRLKVDEIALPETIAISGNRR